MSQAKLLFLLQAYILDQAIHLINQEPHDRYEIPTVQSHGASKDPTKNKASSGTVKQTWNIQIQVKHSETKYRIRPALAREGIDNWQTSSKCI